MCCRPIEFGIELAEDGGLQAIRVQRIDYHRRFHERRNCLLSAAVAALLLAAGCSREAPPAPADTAAAKPAQWQGFVNRFVEDSLKANPFPGGRFRSS